MTEPRAFDGSLSHEAATTAEVRGFDCCGSPAELQAGWGGGEVSSAVPYSAAWTRLWGRRRLSSAGVTALGSSSSGLVTAELAAPTLKRT